MARRPPEDPADAPAEHGPGAVAGAVGTEEEGTSFRRLVESSPDFITRHDGNRTLVYANPAVQRFLEKTFEEMRASSPLLAGAGTVPWRAQMFEKLDETLRTGKPTDLEVVFP